ncbi:glycosyltransferase [Planomicrobium sp. YIM 101495]|uniref:glycosyltransferase n=1 Tax=Planomicrobium sp. YIM 101495 TaxID=2665160 RepID=UPI0012BA327A|nr:glycosyltransferase [Planomicrobium sp. YIM 101495]MTD30770.1 glycosyltransferase [Planomicrobium sp. YIM 101495]
MKVLQINSVCGTGSTGRIATDIHSLLKQQGYESWIAFGRGDAINCEKTIKIGNKIDNYIHVAKTRMLDQHGFSSTRATKELIRKIEKINPDVIHLHNIHGYYINVEILFKYLKIADKKVVWTLHDCWAFTGHCAYFDYVGCDCWKLDGDNKCIQPGSYPASWGINNSKNNFRRKKIAFTGVKDLTIVTPSIWLAELVKESFLSEYPVKVINNGINLENFKPTIGNFKVKNQINDKFIILGVASVWEKRKGLEFFLELSKKISSDKSIVLVGISNEQKKVLPDNIIAIERTNSVKELAEIYSSANVFVNPTLEDNFPTTNIEALACGTPVITFDTGGSPESVRDKNFVIEKENVEELYKVIKSIQKSEFNRKEYRDYSLQFDKNSKFKEYIKCYKGDEKN